LKRVLFSVKRDVRLLLENIRETIRSERGGRGKRRLVKESNLAAPVPKEKNCEGLDAGSRAPARGRGKLIGVTVVALSLFS